MVEEANKYINSVATVVGGKGELGKRVAAGFTNIGFGRVIICDQGDPFTEFVSQSDTIFFAVDADQALDMIKTARASHLLKPSHNILDGASVKSSLIPVYRNLDNLGISVSSTHLGAIPSQPWRGVKVWLCEAGPNSERAQRLAIDLFIAKNTSIQKIDIEEHANVEQVQWFTFATVHMLAAALERTDFSLGAFNRFATLNAELLGLPIGRTLGQGTKVPSEILFTQPKKEEFLESMQLALTEMADALQDREKLEALMKANIKFHDDPIGYVERMFRKAGIVGARNANLRMYAFSFRIVDDKPGKLREILKPFDDESVNITAIDSMVGIITPAEREKGINPDDVVDFDIGVDLKTMDENKEKRIREDLLSLGCDTNSLSHQLT